MPTPEQLANLDKVATYLEGLPEDYEHFAMFTFFNNEEGLQVYPGDLDVNNCPSCACVIGHAPAAGCGQPFDSDFNWFNYAERVFGTDAEDELWDRCFAPWLDGNHIDAARRIREYLHENQ